MKIHTLLSPLNAEDLYFTNKTTVVIDVLRATTTIIYALQNGAREVIPVNSVEFAMKVSGNAFGGQTILGGERNTKKIEGFTLGNSPLEYTAENVSGKSIILYTTNGSRAVVKAKYSSQLLICSFCNIKSLADYLISKTDEIEILCSGSNGMYCLEDTVCAGMLISELTRNRESVLSDASRSSLVLYRNYSKNIKKMLMESDHGQKLISNGFEQDIEIVSYQNTSKLIPYYESGVIKILNIKE